MAMADRCTPLSQSEANRCGAEVMPLVGSIMSRTLDLLETSEEFVHLDTLRAFESHGAPHNVMKGNRLCSPQRKTKKWSG
jgi:hypothetical protein